MSLEQLPTPATFRGPAYRNIYTIKESQALFDDLVGNPSDLPVLSAWDSASSGIDHATPQKNRPFQYAEVSTIDVLIEPGRWGHSRFSDGTFGVWYGALEEQTSIRETLYHAYRFARPDFAPKNFPIVVERKMFEAQLNAARAVDLRSVAPQAPLVADDYTVCQELGRRAIENSYDMYFAPSARFPGGTCTPVFRAEAILSDRSLYFLRFSFLSPDECRVTRDSDEIALIPPTWKN